MLPISRAADSATPLFLGQPWSETPEAGFQPAAVQFHWSDTALHVRAILTDAHIFTTATEHNQSLFALGDTFEVFLMLPDAPEYFELHVSPLNHRAFMRWPLGGIAEVHAHQRALADFRETPEAFASEVRRTAGGWEIDVDVPSTVLGVEKFVAGKQIHVSICRYDYSSLEMRPVLSTIARHEVKNFHRTEDWLPAELV